MQAKIGRLAQETIIQETTIDYEGAVAEWSKAQQLWEKINEYQKDPRFAPRPGHLKQRETTTDRQSPSKSSLQVFNNRWLENTALDELPLLLLLLLTVPRLTSIRDSLTLMRSRSPRQPQPSAPKQFRSKIDRNKAVAISVSIKIASRVRPMNNWHWSHQQEIRKKSFSLSAKQVSVQSSPFYVTLC